MKAWSRLYLINKWASVIKWLILFCLRDDLVSLLSMNNQNNPNTSQSGQNNNIQYIRAVPVKPVGWQDSFVYYFDQALSEAYQKLTQSSNPEDEKEIKRKFLSFLLAHQYQDLNFGNAQTIQDVTNSMPSNSRYNNQPHR